MSRIGKQPIKIPEKVKVEKENGILKISGPKGEIIRKIHPEIKTEIKDGRIFVSLKRDYNSSPKKIKSLWGLYRTLISNALRGVKEGFEKKLEINGVGYKAQVQGDKLILNVGFSRPVEIETPEEIDFSVERNIITVSGIDKEKVGRVAAKIRGVRKADPYKAKGIKYVGEKIRRKEGKKAATLEQ